MINDYNHNYNFEWESVNVTFGAVSSSSCFCVILTINNEITFSTRLLQMIHGFQADLI